MIKFFNDHKVAVHAAFIIIAAGLGWGAHTVTDSIENRIAAQPRRISDAKYKFISPLIACDSGASSESEELTQFQKKIAATIEIHEKEGDIERAGVYFRDMNSGRWIGVEQDQLFWPASLMKVPTMIGVLSFLQKHPEEVHAQILYKNAKDENSGEYFKAAASAQNNQSYSFNDLLQLMISYSDNNAVIALSSVVGKENLSDIYTDFGISIPFADKEVTDYMSPKTYSYFLRILYNADYLNRDLSEFALSLLTQTDFNKGLSAGIPNTVSVAHKFGEQSLLNGDKELHDCGIVYFPGHPYLLCVMTQGSDFEKQATVIKNISAAAYKIAEESYR